ncbi:unnamed protein product [Anisakis simplex]|uniref:RING-type domain-containing protein n=1 Tax=Anisakis simplex TaxID=6269 RepID=A0A0M3K0L1_ANISI|nr:unnamed protein product [Anisakis simplex]
MSLSPFGICPICFEPLEPSNISALRCGHTFHYQCILQWLQSHDQNPSNCPECRQPTTEDSIIKQLFFCTEKESSHIDHEIVQAELEILASDKERFKTLYEQEKGKTKNQELQLKKMQTLETTVQDQTKKIEIHER